MNNKKISAYFIFGILFVWHIIKKFSFKLKTRGIKKFKKNYYPEYLIEISEESYKKLPELENCINCSLCDAYCSKLSTLHRDGLPKISELILASSGSIEEFRFSDNELEVFDNCDDCVAPCITVCPNDYPIFDLLNMMRNYNKDLDKKLGELKEKND